MINPFRVLRRRKKDRDVSGDIDVRQDTPRWVWWFTDVGRPLAAIVVLVLCAPGEQHLAELSGWPDWLSWGMAGLFSMYAGIAAVVATVRPKGSPGKRSAVWGAVLSLLLAMGAQPVSHLFVTGWLSAEPRAPWILIVTVSCVPPFILGHLLHLAASPVSPRTKDKVSSAPVPPRGQDGDIAEDGDTDRTTEDKDNACVLPVMVPGVPVSSGTQWVFEDRTYRAGVPVLAGDKDRDKAVSLIATAFDVPEDILKTYPGTTPDEDTRTGQTDVPEDTPPVRPSWLYDEDGIVPGHREDTGDTMSWSPPPGPPAGESRRTARDDLSSRRKLTDVIKDIRQDVGDDPDAIKDGVLRTPGFEDMRSTPQKRNTLNTAVRRALRKTA